MAQGCSSPSGSDPGVGEAADVALIPSVHPGLRFPDGDPPKPPHVLRQQHSAANHMPRAFNQWADELTHPDFSRFDPLHRVPKQELCEEFIFLPRLLLNGDAFDLSVGPPMLPCPEPVGDSLPLVADPPVAWVPLAPAQGRALSVCTPVLQFLRVCGGWPMGPTQP